MKSIDAKGNDTIIVGIICIFESACIRSEMSSLAKENKSIQSAGCVHSLLQFHKIECLIFRVGVLKIVK